MDHATAEKAEKALFELEELKLRLAAGRCNDERSVDATTSCTAALPLGLRAPEKPVDAASLELLRRRVLELETALQLATLRAAPESGQAHTPDPALLQRISAAVPSGSTGTAKQPPGPAIFSYLTEKLDESLEDRRRFFERYLVVRELALARSQKESTLPLLADASRSLRDGRAPPSQVLAELEKAWLPSDKALLEARVWRARGRHQRLFMELRQKELQAEELLRRCELSRQLDAPRMELLHLLGAPKWRWRQARQTAESPR
ncbi:unnamed protein product [Cladocopium goreaui]|uniref:Uncharacterized protein n=1 Tax=Cladocopium goreaui TaxID=2562237 RepID=A0A9P1CT50_9DINO|nr:unnamed protein product [Cladocopium goreaui]